MRRITGAAALGYVVLAAIENMGLLGAPRLGASAAEIEAAYADVALGVVTTVAGALSLACYLVFAALAAPRWLPAAAAGAGLALGGVVAAALLVGGGDPALSDLQLQLRYLAGPFMALVLFGAAGAMPRPLKLAGRGLAVPLALTPVALAAFESFAHLAFAAHAAWFWAAALMLLVGGPDFVRRAAFLMLVLAAGLVGAALLIVPEATGSFFAWGLKPAPLAAFAGGVYVGSAAVYAAGLSVSRRQAQPLVVAAVVLSVSVLTATFVHLDVFDFSRLQAWAWVALFAAFGITTTGLAITGPWRREAGARLPFWSRTPLGLAAAGARRGGRRAVGRSRRVLAPAAGRALRRVVGGDAGGAGRLARGPRPRRRGPAAGAGADRAAVGRPAGGAANRSRSALRGRAGGAAGRGRGGAQRGTGCRGW